MGYQDKKNLFTKLGGWIEDRPHPWRSDFITDTFFYKCKNCGFEPSFIGIESALKKIQMRYCRMCWREGQEEKRLLIYKEYPRTTDISLDFPILAKNGCADIYARVSTSKQVEGSGLWRQEKNGIEYCQLNQIRVRNIIQDVCSGYNTDNCVTGNLGFKLRQWEKQEEQSPNYLIIEDIDRFTRQNPFLAMAHLARLRDLNIELIVAKDGVNTWLL